MSKGSDAVWKEEKKNGEAPRARSAEAQRQRERERERGESQRPIIIIAVHHQVPTRGGVRVPCATPHRVSLEAVGLLLAERAPLGHLGALLVQPARTITHQHTPAHTSTHGART